MTGGNWGPGGTWDPPRSPWADPSTPTEQGAPYAGPPPTAPYAPGPYGYPAPYYQPAPWGPPPPRRPQRPGQLVTAAVLAFAQAVVVLIASLYVWFFASVAGVAAAEAGGGWSPGDIDALATEGTVLAIVQLVSAVGLVGAGVWALSTRRRSGWALLVAALAVQVLLAGYWAVRLWSEIGDSTLVPFALLFAAGPLVGLGMLLVGPGRRWFGAAVQG